MQNAVTVTNGMFTVMLNISSQFGADAFTGAARWLEIQVCKPGSVPCIKTTLTPRQEITAAPYALGLRPGAVIKGAAYQNLKVVSSAPTGGIPAGVTGEITAAADGVGVYGSNTVHVEGSTGIGVWGRTWSEEGAGVKGTGLNYADGVFGESDGVGVHGVGDAGVMGVGTAQGNSGTGVVGYGQAEGEGVMGRNTTGVAGYFDTDSSTAYPQVLLKENADDYARLSFRNNTAGKSWTIAGYPSATDANARLNLWYSPVGDVMSLTGSGKVGIGTSAPDEKLVVNGGNAITRIAIDSSGPGNSGIRLRQGGVSRWSVATSGTDGDFQIYEDDTGNNRLYIKGNGSGNVGIGTMAPAAQLHVESSTSGGLGLFVKAGPGGKAAKFAGNVQLTDASGNYLVMELGQGLDYAEAFDVTGLDRATPGTVLVIDPEHPGQLAVSSIPYDHKVAGIVAGAGGTGSGVRLGVGQYDVDVALAGRGYCNVDASEETIQPGDLLTTSERRAMP